MNRKTGANLGADLVQLRAMAVLDLPNLAEIYLGLNKDLADTHHGDHDAFACGPTSPGGMSPVYRHWAELRDTAQRIFGQTKNNLEETGWTVDYVVEKYEETDHEAAKKFRDIWPDGASPPAYLDKSGDNTITAPLPAVDMP